MTAIAAAAAILALATLFFAPGQVAGHARSHVAGALVAAASSALVVLALRKAASRFEALARAALVAALWLFALGQILEAAGAFGWDEYSFAETYPALTALHDVALGVSFVALPLVAISFALLVVSLLARRIGGAREGTRRIKRLRP